MSSPARRSPMARPMSFVWTRRIVLTLLGIFAALPVYVMLSTSLKPLQDVTGKFHWFPHRLTLRPYVDIWHTVPLAHYFLNSIIVSAAATGLSVLVAVFAAYAVSRYRFKGKRAVHDHCPVHADVPRASSSCSRCS